MIHSYWVAFTELVSTPFEHIALIWGIVPLYFALFLNELTSTKANFRTAIQTGFSFLWAGAQWLYAYWAAHRTAAIQIRTLGLPINLFVTLFVLALGALALFSG